MDFWYFSHYRYDHSTCNGKRISISYLLENNVFFLMKMHFYLVLSCAELTGMMADNFLLI